MQVATRGAWPRPYVPRLPARLNYLLHHLLTPNRVNRRLARWLETHRRTGQAFTAAEKAVKEKQAAETLTRLSADTSRAGGRGVFVRADISAVGGTHPSWVAPVRAYFRRTSDSWKLVGFERMPDAPDMRPGLVGAEPR